MPPRPRKAAPQAGTPSTRQAARPGSPRRQRPGPAQGFEEAPRGGERPARGEPFDFAQDRPVEPRRASAAPPSTRSGRAGRSESPQERQTPPPPKAPRPPQGRPPEESWDQVAAWYDSLASDQGTDFHQQVIIPGVLRLLDLRKGERVLDLACGQGAVSRALHRAGAQVTGVDLSPRLIELACQRSPQAMRYLVGDVRRLDQLGDASFDAATCVLGAQNLDPLGPMLAEAARLLRAPVDGQRPGGRLVLVVTHPAFRIPRQSGWRWDESRKLMFREEARYLTPLKIPIDMRPFKAAGQQITWTYHRPIQDYVNGLAAVGLWTNALEEWPSHKVSQPGPASRGENRAREEFPLFLALRAVKVG